ncbi:ABC transporter ATP-binding protein [Pseudoalteromonas piscicida]|uniref:ABC transporter ATP-binding protein n=1 Tax=Pseudoalteromonas piscicida TaxID=43662 RepID=A0A2A5JN76_PSEO7|nr:ABC transporter ATP-binding protein [Pseudoalteromonas piscicida]PCK30711.1 ABC transporter ATP-binding protein [Pseudoalteromonas piscicida]
MTDSNKKTVISLRDIVKVYHADGVETQALKGVNLDIDYGDFMSISGPSGCGKSTLLSILGLLDTPTSGKYLIEGVDTSTLDVDQQADLRNLHIGFVFQSFNLIDEMSVFDNVALPLTYRLPSMPADEIKQKVIKCLSQVEMDHRINHKPNQLSGGQQQRIAIARALVGDPSVILVDEPTGNLDSKNGDVVMNMLAELNQNGTTLCMVTHDPRYAGFASQRCELLDGYLQNMVRLKEAI